MASASIPAPPLPSRQATPSDTKGILSNGNVKLDERLDLLDFLDTIEAPGEAPSGSSSSSSEAPTVVGVSTLPAAAVGWSSSSFAPQHSSSYGFGSSFGSRRQHYSTALEVARDAEVQSSLNIMQDEIPAEAPWWLQASYCFCTPPPCCDFVSRCALRVSLSFLACARTVFQCFGVEPTMRHTVGLLPPKPQLKLRAALSVLDRHSKSEGYSPVSKRTRR